MHLHRFYVGQSLPLEHYIWVNEPRLINQWQKVLRFRPGQEVVLFDGERHERLYVINELKSDAAHLELITDFERQLPKREIYLFWALLKSDKNNWVLQKCTELGVSHFIPLLAERSEKTGFQVERAEKIIIEAAEQCGRSDIPRVREPLLVQTALHEFNKHIPLYVCDLEPTSRLRLPAYDSAGVLVGPEGGWSENEKKLFIQAELGVLHLGDFILRAETACLTASTQLLNA